MFTLNCKGRLLSLHTPVVMGILNITPDSFYAGSRVTPDAVFQKAEMMLRDGATILDVGGQSTRPGSLQLDADTEMQRIIDVIHLLHRNFPEAVLSVDTYHSKVAAAAVAAGAGMINDISGGHMDAGMLQVAGTLGVPYVAMHMKGTPATMQKHAQYENITREVLDYYIERVAACTAAGIHDVIIDPGFGFAKTPVQNLHLLKEMAMLKMPERPILVGLSRKSTVYKLLNTSPEQALNGSTVLHTIALLNGASILRVHDVREAMEAIQLVAAYHSS